MNIVLSLQAKQMATEHHHRPAMEVIEDIILAVPERQRFLLPKQSLLKRSTNRLRAKARPAEPKDLDFIVSIIFALMFCIIWNL